MERKKRKTEEIALKNPPLLSILKNDRGFTYIELVISLSLLVLLLPALFFSARTLETEIKKLVSHHRLQMEYIAFVTSVQAEIRQGRGFRTDEGALLFDLPTGETIRYKWQKRQVVRSVKKKGETAFKGMTVLANHVYFITFVPGRDKVMIDIGLQNWNANLDMSVAVAGRVEP
ncbi:hypothetical protein ACFO25_06640 [Paenactinomyces guangxiensis]|uniref:Prepilin-type N-terminal cleavage/methylation domain-containing protein n=1 Tax=Paenactinomyces guangxiensis TaxID=1490290 RepID=A0A7W1WNQ5_9BACL|nr:hypothetical protein [Paenactinomyces guangxiensis]MBA4493272.1 hypothetical protein [Paenactinomyces guangxiensis]MBH8589877.1 hypothetical protein [Paenactinomyces guangxiensis]